uniref:Late embryogenesis abundant protein LEA-2 subgroup domain-containing protein n=1 Tax=Spongospora subterranea TaxID=70186 RepID=A0A0H5QXX8_9EUKA|eukprot:CRZ06602.1 hypothetical protein [Spongospora subterranea]
MCCGGIACLIASVIGGAVVIYFLVAMPSTDFNIRADLQRVQYLNFTANGLALNIFVLVSGENTNGFEIELVNGEVRVEYPLPTTDYEVGVIDHIPNQYLRAKSPFSFEVAVPISVDRSYHGMQFYEDMVQKCTTSREGWRFETYWYLKVSAGGFPIPIPIWVDRQDIVVACPSVGSLLSTAKNSLATMFSQFGLRKN